MPSTTTAAPSRARPNIFRLPSDYVTSSRTNSLQRPHQTIRSYGLNDVIIDKSGTRDRYGFGGISNGMTSSEEEESSEDDEGDLNGPDQATEAVNCRGESVVTVPMEEDGGFDLSMDENDDTAKADIGIKGTPPETTPPDGSSATPSIIVDNVEGGRLETLNAAAGATLFVGSSIKCSLSCIADA